METSSIIGSTQASTADASSARLSGTFDQFLALLTTQMQYQDPLSPMDSTEFTNQLVQFSGVEQAINQNKNLESLITLNQTNQASMAVSFIGKQVIASGNETALENGSAEWRYILSDTAATTNINILDEKGNVIRKADGQIVAGQHIFKWDGVNDQGQIAPDGLYTIQITSTTPDDLPVEVMTDFVGVVTGVGTDAGDILLDVNGVFINANDVISVQEAPEPAV